MNKNKISKAAQKHLVKGQIDKAIAEWQKLLAKNEGDGNVYNTIGDLYLRKNDKQGAVDSFKTAAEVFKKDGFTMKAIALYKKILNIKQEDIDSVICLAELNAEKGLINYAGDEYLKAAELCLNDGATDKALELLERVIAISPDNTTIREKIATIYDSSGMKKQASDEYTKIASKLKSENDKDKTFHYYKKAIETDENNTEALIGLSIFEEESENIETAYQYIQKAFSITPEDVEVLLLYARLSTKTENFHSAKEALIKLEQLESSNKEAKKMLGDIYIKEGELEKAWKLMLPIIDDKLKDEHWLEAHDILNHFKEIEPVEVGKRLVKIFKNTENMESATLELQGLASIYERDKLYNGALQVYSELNIIDPSNEEYKEKFQEFKQKLADQIEDEIDQDKESSRSIKPEQDDEKNIILDSGKTLEESLKEIDILINYELQKDALAALEKLREKFPESIEIKERFKKLNKPYETSNHTDNELVDSNEIEEDLAEADFYAQQGLLNEAIEIYQRLLKLSPQNKEIIDKLNALKNGEITHGSPIDILNNDLIDDDDITNEITTIIDENPSEGELQKSVEDVFHQFKQNVEKEIDTEDYDTHYDLGIAYREMGMIDDAIEEFRYTGNNAENIKKGGIMLGMCYLEKGLHEEAVQEYSNVLNIMSEDDEGYLDIKYSIAEALEKNQDTEKALSIYKNISMKNASFRDVASKISEYEHQSK